MNSASRGFQAEERRIPDVAEAASSSFASAVAVADDGSLVEALQAEFDRRLSLLDDRRDAVRLFAVASSDRGVADASVRDESLAAALAAGGPMPADVAEECVRGLLAALRSAHGARWSHGELSLEAFALDADGRVVLRGAGRSQRSAWLDAEALDREALSLDSACDLDRRWDEAFLDGAADDLRRLASRVVPALSQAVDGAVPLWAERLQTRLDAVDGTIATVEDLDHAWRTIDGAFDSRESAADDGPSLIAAAVDSVEAPSEGAFDAAHDRPMDVSDDRPIDVSGDWTIEETSQDLQRESATSPMRDALSSGAVLWAVVAGGLAALAGAVALIVSLRSRGSDREAPANRPPSRIRRTASFADSPPFARCRRVS